jgi:hypothetical protein
MYDFQIKAAAQPKVEADGQLRPNAAICVITPLRRALDRLSFQVGQSRLQCHCKELSCFWHFSDILLEF